jgi:predicted glycosyltransferase
MEQLMDEKESVQRFVQGWNASLYELEDLLDEMEDTKNKKVLETIQEIRDFIKTTENYWQLIKVDQ